MRSRTSTKDDIRATAIRLIAEKGFEQTSLREVAEAVGITKASLYYHYASKRDLLIAIVEPIFDEMRAVDNELSATPHTPDGVRRVMQRYLAGLIRHREVGELFTRDTVAIVNAIKDQYPELIELNQRLQEWLAGPNAPVEAQLRATATLQVLGVALHSGEVHGATDDDVARVLLACAMAVLGGS